MYTLTFKKSHAHNHNMAPLKSNLPTTIQCHSLKSFGPVYTLICLQFHMNAALRTYSPRSTANMVPYRFTIWPMDLQYGQLMCIYKVFTVAMCIQNILMFCYFCNLTEPTDKMFFFVVYAFFFHLNAEKSPHLKTE